MGDRAAFIKVFLDGLEAILPKSQNVQLYETYLNELDDASFEALVQRIESGELILPLYTTLLKGPKLEVDRNLALGKKWGHDFFQQIDMTDQNDPSLTYRTPKKYLVLELPVRRQIQTLVNKLSVPKNNTHIDELTGQVTGESKGSGMTFPELQILQSKGLDATIREFYSVRGGNEEAYREFEKSIIENGGARLDSIKSKDSRTKSTESLSILMKSAHLGNNL